MSALNNSSCLFSPQRYIYFQAKRLLYASSSPRHAVGGEEATAKPSPPTGFSRSDLRHGVTWAFTSGRWTRLQLLLATAQRAAAMPRAVIGSRGLVMPKCAPTYLSAIRSPGNRDQIGRPLKHQEVWQRLHKSGPGVGGGGRTVTHNPSNGRVQSSPLQ